MTACRFCGHECIDGENPRCQCCGIDNAPDAPCPGPNGQGCNCEHAGANPACSWMPKERAAA